MSKSLEKKKVTTKNKKVVKEKSEKVEKVKESKIKKLTKKQLIIIGSIFAACILVAIISISLLSDRKETEPEIKTCLVQFNTNGGLEIEAASLECGGTINEPEAPEKNGFTFLGWYLNDKEYDFKSKIDNNVVLEAKWEAKEDIKIVVVSFDTAGGSKQTDIEVQKGTYLTKPVDPIKENHIFVGWYLDGEEFSFISNTIDENIELKAKWKKIKKQTNENNTFHQNSTNIGTADVDKENIDISSKYDDIVKDYSGRWYLSGYEDVTCDIKRAVYDAMSISCINYNIEKKHVIYVTTSWVDINYNKWDSDIKDNEISLNSSSINIANSKFIRNKGSKNRNDETYYQESIGTWYLYNRPGNKIVIEGHKYTVPGVDFDDQANYNSVCIQMQINGSTTSECGTVRDNYIYNKIGITIDGETLYLKVNNDNLKFYKTKKVINVTRVDLNNSSLKLNIGDSATLSATITPSDAYNKNVTWSSSDTNVATVSSSGKVTAKGEGTATITVTTTDGSYTAKCVVTVSSIKVSSISLNKTSVELVRGNTETLTATILPNNATNKNVTWSSDNSNVATVNDSGKVTAVSKGTATITVTTDDGSYTATCIVTVSNPPLTISSSIGIKTVVYSGESVSTTQTIRGVNASVEASGGTGAYTYYYIKIYKEGKLIGSTTNTSRNELFVACGTNGSFTINGNYTMEYEVRDSDGTIKKGTSSSTISGY